MFKIGEFSKLTQVTIRMLRYYDETGLLKPAEIDKFTGYRFYSVGQLPILHKIIFLRDIGYTVSEIAAAMDNWSGEFMWSQLKKKQLEIKNTIQQEQGKLKKIENALESIENEEVSIPYNFIIKKIPSYPVLSFRKIIPNYFCEGLLWKQASIFIENEKINLPQNGHNFAIYHDEDYREENVDVEVCTTVGRLGESKGDLIYRETEAIDTMACAMVYGPFENIGAAFHSLAQWLSEHDEYKMTGQNRQICHRGPWNEESPDKYLTEIQIPLEKQL